MTTLIQILIILASIALILVVIVQKSKGGGLAASFSGANNIMGVRKATDGIEKATWYLISAVIGLSILYSAVSERAVSRTDSLMQGVEQKAAATQSPSLPSLGGQQGNIVSPTEAPASSTPQEASTPAEASQEAASQTATPEQN